jgi:hypothetical protein
MPTCAKRALLISGMVALVLATWVWPMLSEAETGGAALDPRGKPKGFHTGATVRYAIWHNDNGWHLRTTTAKREHVFRGHIRVEGGTFERIYSHDLEKEGKLRDWWRVGPERHRVTFDFKTDRGLDGIDFRVSKSARRIHFELHIDGRPEPSHVFVGRFDQHPVAMPFDLPAHP